MDGVTIQKGILESEICRNGRGGVYLKIGEYLLLLPDNDTFANQLIFALKRNAKAFEASHLNEAEGKKL